MPADVLTKPKQNDTAPTRIDLVAAPLDVVVRNPNTTPLRPLSLTPEAIAMRESRDARSKKRLSRAYSSFRVKKKLESKVIAFLEARRPDVRDKKLTPKEFDAVLMEAYGDLIEAGLAALTKK